MTISQRVTWTLLPNGAKDATTLRASVYVSPRLSIPAADLGPGEKPDLSHFPEWLEWPKRIASASFRVNIGGSAVAATRVSPDPQLDVWSALFPPSMPVQPYDFAGRDFSGKTVLSYPVATVYKNVRSIYGQLGAAGGETPTGGQLAFLLGPTRAYNDLINELLQIGGNPFNGIRPRPFNPTVAPPPPINREDFFTALNLLALYHRPLNQQIPGFYAKKTDVSPPDIHENVTWRAYQLAALPKAEDLVAGIDFHRIVAALGQYQNLLRATGLVVDLEFARPAADGDNVIQVQVAWRANRGVPFETDLLPRIRTTLQGDSFYATPRDISKTAILERFFRLRRIGPQFYPKPLYFDLVEMDVDGAGLKLKNFLLGWQSAARAAGYDDETDDSVQPPEVTAPSLRSGGLMLANRNRDMDVSSLFARNKTLDQQSTAAINSGTDDPGSDEALLGAEDVVRGYRADIYDTLRKRWFSLNFRNGTYSLQNTGKDFVSTGEEGMARLAAATSTDGANADIVKVHEGLFTWRGWSLAAPEPGQSLLAEIDPAADTTKPENVVGSGEADVPDGLPLKPKFTVTPGTLPSLRFGRTYMMRVRLADLAGNSAPFSADDAQPPEAVSDSVVYRRYEPIESPALALVRAGAGVERPADGESMSRVAIRTFNDTPAKNTVPIADRARRHIVPPRATHRFAETHGVMDGPDGKLNPNLYDTLSLKDNALDTETWNEASGQKLTYAAADQTFTLPYLPDPWALGVVFKVDGLQPAVNPQKLYPVAFYATNFAYSATKRPDWPNAKPFTIVISENGPTEPAFDPAAREFRITMHKGERARVRVSSIMPTTQILSMAMAAMIAEQNLSQADQLKIGTLIASGQHWMFTPWRTIELVHAVQKPLITPAVKQPITIDRQLGWGHAVPTMVLALNSKSTAKIDVNARWVEPNDDPTALLSLPSGYDGNKIRYPGPAGQPPLTPADPGVINHAARAFELKISRLSSVGNTFTVGGPTDPNATTDKRPQHVFGDTHYRRVTYQIDATTRFREFMPADKQAPAEVTVSSPDDDPKGITWIPNAATPPTPKLLYVVPTFGWGQTSAGNQSRSFRSGGGLRVYLDRPWFTTGFTEMLAVVLPPGPIFHNWAAYGDAQALPPYVTQWGADPVWVGGRVQTVAPQPDAFPLAKWRAPISFAGTAFPPEEGSDLPPGDFPVTGLRVPEMMQTPDFDPATPGELAVAPHAVGYDAERQLWYADIVVRPGDAYFPFIRLALARYNPVSVPGAHLSSIVMAEFVQLTPDRLAVVTQDGNNAHVAIYGTGTTEPVIRGPRSGLFELAIETLPPGADEDLGWRQTAGQPTVGLANPAADLSPPPLYSPAGAAQRATPGTNPAAVANSVLARGQYTALLSRPELIAALAPPFLWQGDTALPNVGQGTRVRLVITESEVFQTAERTDPNFTGSRVVYLETIELSPPHMTRLPLPPIQEQQQPLPRPLPPIRQVPPIIRPLPTPVPPTPPPLPPIIRVPPLVAEPPPVVAIPNFGGEWDAVRGRIFGIHWHLEQNGTAVTGTYLPPDERLGIGAAVNGMIDAQGQLDFAWVERNTRGPTGVGRGYLVLVSPDEWQGRWWVGTSVVDPTPTQPNTWHGTRPPPLNTLPKLREILPRLQLNRKP